MKILTFTFSALIIQLSVFTIHAQDAVFEWAARFGGPGNDAGFSIATDASGSVFTTGKFSGTADFDPGAATYDLTSAGSEDIFVSKLDASGNFVWAYGFGGASLDQGRSIAVDPSGNIIVLGYFRNTIDFDPGPGVFSLTAGSGLFDVFILKLDGDGNFLWAVSFGDPASNSDLGYSVATDDMGSVYATGTFSGTADFDPGAGIFPLSAFSGGGFTDVFILKLDESGNFVWAKSIGGTSSDIAFALDVDLSNNVIIGGHFYGTVDFDPGPGVNNITSSGTKNLFILKLDTNGDFVWAKNLISSASDLLLGVATDANDNVFVTGEFYALIDLDPGPGSFTQTEVSGGDIFILKLDASGDFLWGAGIGDNQEDSGRAIAVDAGGNSYFTGHYAGTVDFDPGPGVFNLSSTTSNTYDIFISKYDPSGNFLWAGSMGGLSDFELGAAITIDTQGNICITGDFYNVADFDPGSGVFNLTGNGTFVEAFVVKLASVSAAPTISSFAPTSSPIGTTVTITGTNFSATPANNIVYFGATQATVTAATGTQLTTNVPVGATYAPLTVLNITTDLLAYSMSKFTPTFMPNKCNITSADFDPKTDFTTGSNPISVAIGDLDGDGKADMAVGNTASNTVSVLRNISTSPGTISYAAKVDFPAANDPETVAIGDLDGDGKLDLAVANYIGFSVSVFRNTSTGAGNINYATKVDFALGSPSRFVAIGDFDGDGKADLAAVGETSHVVSVFRNTSTGPGNINYAARVDFATGAGSGPRSLSIDDFDGDGKADLAVGNFNISTISVFRNTSTGAGNISFAAKEDLTAGTNPISVSSGDFDGDGKLDLAALNLNSNTLSVFRNTSSGVGNINYATKVDYTTGTATRSVTAGDLDGDGKADLVVTNHSSGTVSVFRNTSLGATIISYATMVDFTSAPGSIFASVGDLDNDGKSDLAVANASSNSISVIRNNPVFSTITNFTPTSGQIGTTVTITGTNFSTTPIENVVHFNGVAATVTASTSTTITTSVPAGASTGPISVSIGCSTVVSTVDFVVTAPGSPTITSFTPSSGPIDTTVIITGTNFSTTSTNNTVMFNGTTSVVTASTATSITTTVPTGATTGTITVTIAGNTATSATNFTVTSSANQPPFIASATLIAGVEGSATFDLLPLISDPDGNLDPASLSIVQQPTSGASAAIVSGVITIDYSGISFSGTDLMTIEVCDLSGSCVQQQINIEVVGDIIVYTGISPNGDGQNDTWIIRYIDAIVDTRENVVSIYNRWGDLVFEVSDYDNNEKVFKGINNSGKEVPSGIYFYKIEFLSGREPLNGYLTIRK